MSKDHECSDGCIVDDELWDCGCYSHNPPGAGHAKNPAYRGFSHSQLMKLSDPDWIKPTEEQKARIQRNWDITL